MPRIKTILVLQAQSRYIDGNMSLHRMAFVAYLLSSSLVFGAEAEKKSEAPATHTIKKGSLKSKGQVDAVVEPRQMEAVKLTPKSWSARSASGRQCLLTRCDGCRRGSISRPPWTT